MDDRKPWLSVLVPAFNVENFVTGCLESILSQIAGDRIELVVLDDASTDGTARLIADLQDRHSGRMRIERVEANIGVNEVRNRLLDRARGDYVWFVDADDRMSGRAVDALRTIVAKHAPDVVLCDFRRIPLYPAMVGQAAQFASFAGPARQVLSDRSVLLAGLYMAGHMQLWSKVFKRRLWDSDFRLPLGTHFEDIAFSSLVASRADTYYYEPSAWIEYRENPASVVRTMTLKKYVELADAIRRSGEVLKQHRSILDGAAFSAFMSFRDRHFVLCYRELLRYPPGPERSQTLAAVLALYRQSLDGGERRAFRYLKKLDVKKYIRIRKWEGRARRAAAALLARGDLRSQS